MSNPCTCGCGNNNTTTPDESTATTGILHTNAFIDLNGIPYILADYMDKNGFQQIDRSYVQSGCCIDQSESMRTIVDISVDCIGKNSDCTLKVDGNTTKQAKLIKMVEEQKESLGHQLGVLRANLVARINYRLVDRTSGTVIRSTIDDLRIPNRSYFIDINPNNIDDNAIITNFSGTMISGVSTFTHGRNPMAIQVTDIQLYYEFVKRVTPGGRVKDASAVYPDTYVPPYNLITANTQYHSQHQPFVCLNDHQCTPGEVITPSDWVMFNRFYHFDNNGKDLILHKDEIYNTYTDFALIPCGRVTVNRTFVVNPCNRLIFKLSIWKNDVTVMNDTTPICTALQAPPYAGIISPSNPDTSCGCEDSDSLSIALRMLSEANQTIKNNHEIMKEMHREIHTLRTEIEKLKNPVDPVDPDNPDPPIDPPEDNIGCECGCSHPTMIPIPPDYVSDLIDNIP